MGLVGEGVGQVDVGEISISGIQGAGVIHGSSNGDVVISATFSALVLYDSIILEKGYPIRRDDILLSPWEKFSGSLSGVMRAVEDEPDSVRWRMREGVLGLIADSESKVLGSVERVSLSLTGIGVSTLPTTVCPVGRLAFSRTLTVRPVVFELKDGGQTGGSMAFQFPMAKQIWGGCCVKILDRPPRVFTRQEIEMKGIDAIIDKGVPDGIAALYDDNPLVVEIFFVTHDLKDYGGGATLNGGMSQAKIVLTDQSSTNHQLLAHELGHVFNGDHPFSKDPTFWPADPNTVLSPTKPNPVANTLSNCRRVRNPALIPDKPPLSCCFALTIRHS